MNFKNELLITKTFENLVERDTNSNLNISQ